jgi:RNA polymerase sigma-70 factor (ECF subfamily)
MDDLQAIHRLKLKDISGLETLIARYQNKAVRMAYLITHDEPMAEDVVQDSFVRFYKSAHHFDETRRFEPYFLGSVIHAALNAVEREKRITDLPGENDTGLISELLNEAAQVEDQVQLLQLKREVFAALQKLSPRQRAVIVQRYYLEMSEKEMSEALGSAPGTVKWLLNAARQKLRRLLASERMPE